MTSATCANCDAPLTGPYCAQCGQHAHESARSLAALWHDGWHVLTHLDGRLWATLHALLFRPGQLTREYFAERRARYLPPVRLYLVLSVLFFGIAAIGSHDRFEAAKEQLRTDPRVVAKAQSVLVPARQAAAAARTDPAGAERAVARLSDAIDALDAEPAAQDATPASSARAPVAGGTEPAAAAPAGGEHGWHKTRDSLDFRVEADDCDHLDSSFAWLQESLRGACRRHIGDSGRTLLRGFNAAVPRMLFGFMPLMAAVMLLLYWWPRRYYVEHLVFFLHTHSGLFLAASLLMALGHFGARVPALSWVPAAAWAVGLLYTAWYVYRAMRAFYGQGRWLTFGKGVIVGAAYLVFLVVTLLATAFVSLLTT